MNPWSAEHWNLTAQGQYVVKHGLEAAHKKAIEAGTTLNGKPKVSEEAQQVIIKNFILTKRIGSTGGGIVGAGSSGSGPPEG